MSSTAFLFLYRTSILLLLLASTIITPVYAQIVHKQLSNIDGLSNNSINCIFEDSRSTLWIGTWDGLNAYNGREFKAYRYNKNNPYSISNNVIRQIVEESAERIWFATDYGINRWNAENQNFDSYFCGNDYPIPKHEKSFLLSKTSRQKIVCYVREAGFFYFNNDTQEFKPLTIPNLDSDLKDFAIDSDNNIFFLTASLKVWQGKINHEGDGIVIDLKPEAIEQTVPVSNIFLTQNKLILNYRGHIKIIDKENSYPTTIDVDKNKEVSQIVFHDNSLYVSYYEGGCEQYDLRERTQSVVAGDLFNKTSIFSLYIGSQNILWVGTDGQGLYEIYEHNSPFKSIKTNHPVRSFCETDDKNILIGTKGDGIKLLKKDASKMIDYLNISNGLTSNSIYVVKKNQAGDIFIGSEGEGITILKGKTNKIEKLNGTSGVYFKSIYSICFTNNDSVLWLGTSGYGLIKIELYKNKESYSMKNVTQFTSENTQNALNNNIIYTMMPDDDKTHLWIGTRGGGVYKFNTKTNSFTSWDDIYNISLTNNDILSIQMDSHKNLWIGTSYGLNHIILNGDSAEIKEFTDNEYLPNNTIHGVLEDTNQTIWISTNAGISSINQKNNTIKSYTVNDGLQNNEFADGAYFRGNDNILYFGGVSGLSYFDPDKIYLRGFDPMLDLSSLKIDNVSQNISERIKDSNLKLSNDESQISLTFIARDFINNENCEYNYRLLNSSDEWIHNGNNPNIVFAKLSPGEYTLEVRCTNGDKVWGSQVYSLTLDVAYPWWLSTPAFIGYLLLALIIAYITRSVIRNRVRLSKQILLEHIEKEHQQKIHESRLDFFTNVAHEFFTPLTLIYGPAQYLLEKSDLDGFTRHYIQIIKNNADRMQKLISELMEFRKLESGHTPLHPENVNIKMMVDYISDNYTEISQENKINFTISTTDVLAIITDRNSLEKILFNLISNAFKYTPVGGAIHIDAKQNLEDKAFEFTIRNTGNGLTAKQISQLFSKFRIFDNSKVQNATSTGIGLNLTKSLVELLGGTIDVSSELAKYVEFRVIIPPMQMSETAKTVTEDTETLNMLYPDTLQPQDKKEISILIIEDERNIRELLTDILKPYYNVVESEDGEEALKKLELNMPDIIISDIMMPKLDGINLMSRLKADPRTAHIPIISISAKNSIEDHIHAYEHGTDLYIPKPFHPRHVLIAVENLIGKNQMLKDYFNSSRSSMTIKNGVVLHSEDEQFLHQIVTFIEQNIEDESLGPNSISDFMGISKASLYRRLKELTDKTPSEFVRTIRLEHASKLLITTKLTAMEVMFHSGFSNKSYFYREFGKQYGMSPKEYRNKQKK